MNYIERNDDCFAPDTSRNKALLVLILIDGRVILILMCDSVG